MPHVTLAGDLTGEYVVREQRSDGSLVLTPESAYEAGLRERGLRRATPEEFEAFVTEHGVLPHDGEG